MDNELDFIIIQEHKLVLQKAKGIVGKAEFIAMLTKLNKTEEYKDTTRILTDLRGAQANYSIADIEDVTQFILQHNVNTNTIYNALLTDEPSLTAVSLLYQLVSSEIPNYTCAVFSTEKSAAAFLNLPLSAVVELVS